MVTLCMGVLCVGLVTTSIVMFSTSMENTREKTVQRYAETITNWTTYRQQLQHSNFTAVAESPVHLGKDTSLDAYRDEEQSQGLPSYKPLRFHTDSVPADFLPTLTYAMPPSENANVTFNAVYEVPGLKAVKSTFSIGDFSLWTKTIIHAQTPAPETKCPRSQHGVYVKGKCEIYHRLSEICVQVELKGDKTWALALRDDTDPLSFGCELTKDRMTDKIKWKALTYTLVQPTHSSGSGYTFPETTLEDVKITVRSNQDPYEQAEAITKGSLNFGISSYDAFYTGVVLLVIGLLLGVQPSCALYHIYMDRSATYDRVARDEGDLDESTLRQQRPDSGFFDDADRSGGDSMGQQETTNAMMSDEQAFSQGLALGQIELADLGSASATTDQAARV